MSSGPSTRRRLLALSARERQLLFEAWWALLAAATRLRLAPRRTVAKALAGPPAPGSHARPSAGTSEGPPPGTPQAIALAVSRAAAHHLGSMTCLPRAIALQRMLARRGIPAALRIGVRKEPADGSRSSAISAHAWVEVEGQALGEPEAIADRFLPLAASAERTGASPNSKPSD